MRQSDHKSPGSVGKGRASTPDNLLGNATNPYQGLVPSAGRQLPWNVTIQFIRLVLCHKGVEVVRLCRGQSPSAMY